MPFLPALPTIAMAVGASAETVTAASVIGASLPSLATVATIGSSAVSALGSIAQSRASAASAGYNAKVQARNAEIATRNSQFAGAEGEANTAAASAKTRAALASTVADQGASGVDINSPSSVNTRESVAKIGTLNALNVRAEAARRAYGFQTESASDTAQSQLLRKQQKSDTTGGYLEAGANVLGGFGAASKYETWLNNGGL